jgi:hypothetical protein
VMNSSHQEARPVSPREIPMLSSGGRGNGGQLIAHPASSNSEILKLLFSQGEEKNEDWFA